MDGTQCGSIPIAQGKTRSAALFRRQTKLLAELVNKGNPATLTLLPEYGSVASAGGFLIVIDGKLVGAIGASGGIPTQDGVTATAGLDSIARANSHSAAGTRGGPAPAAWRFA